MLGIQKTWMCWSFDKKKLMSYFTITNNDQREKLISYVNKVFWFEECNEGYRWGGYREV